MVKIRESLGLAKFPPKEEPKPDSKPEPTVELKPERVFCIGLSPGHGGGDTGAVSATGLQEQKAARDVCDALEARFKENPAFDVAVYGFNETKKNYGQRVKDSNARPDDFYIPIHFNNWAPNPNKNGWLIFVDPQDSEKNPALQPLVKEILSELQTSYPIGYGDWDENKDGYMEGIGRKVYEETAPNADSIYLELGYLSHPEWDKKMREPENHKKIADAIVTGFEKFFDLSKFRKA